MNCAIDHETDLLARCESLAGRMLAAQGDRPEPELRQLQAELAEALAARRRVVGENINRKGPNQ